ncbi:uncharacterized protein E0L32_001643 [Thyridium curvatum]|uniref:Isopenicillin N synthase-like Fe(2+) 2OG dioxygenase domain-containing protein n=1 Tax=Thyridium curvatum TaxID=1093900 RepID=A0A507AN70_9PEZI|nr:uncharacterized protein E0L32_001554 [Thyridium curvatum]XP_030990894.1 uncharacterized protein E0L32_001643 [Thyridium curvatum]TPX09094.1 hypothetical protein E0L32_001554 [Thyridium curvatum]TPX09183.1 hypothetical protein E0L32_001643 [Thyridium curvatum]
MAPASLSPSPEPDVPMGLPVIDLDLFLKARDGQSDADAHAAAQAECARAANALVTYGALVLHDSRVSEADNSSFLDLMEEYFAQPDDALRQDERPELSYQVGITLDNTEKPKCAVDEPCLRVIERLAPSERPQDVSAHQPDPKCRFFWRVVEDPPYESEFPGLNAANVTPAAPGIKEKWKPTMDQWGASMKTAVTDLAEMAALGMGLPGGTFKDAGAYGPHLLAPTASDLRKYGEKDTILAGFHTDLNFLTIHGRSRYPGLHIWARNTGKRIAVVIPEGNYLLVQAGKQMEHLTGGLVKAGYHEVVVTQRTLDVMARRAARQPDRPQIRISSTFFWHLSSDYDLRPIPQLADRARAVRLEQMNLGKDEGDEVEYPPMKVGHQVEA